MILGIDRRVLIGPFIVICVMTVISAWIARRLAGRDMIWANRFKEDNNLRLVAHDQMFGATRRLGTAILLLAIGIGSTFPSKIAVRQTVFAASLYIIVLWLLVDVVQSILNRLDIITRIRNYRNSS